MTSTLLAVLFSLLSVLPHAPSEDGYYRFEPIAPTDRTFVVLQVRQSWRDGCLPINDVVTRNGNAITVRWGLRGGGCPLAVQAWSDDVPLGVLPAGVYTVTLQVDDRGTLQTLETLRLVVTEGAPAVRLEPAIASTAGGSVIRFPDICTESTVSVDGVQVPAQVERCVLTATLPAHAPGPVNVRVGSSEIVNGVQYVDPAAAPDPSLYERVLVPVIYNGPGAFGSQWQTDTIMRNFSRFPMESLPDVSRPLATLGGEAATSISERFGNRATGLVLFVPRGSDLGFTSHIRDVSRDATQWGTEMPIVRERDTRETLVFANVPFDPRYRLQLRIYGIDGVGSPMLLFVAPNAYRQVVTRGPCTAMPCNSNEPAYASVDLGQVYTGLTGRQTIAIQQQLDQPRRLWAFITVTNNDTQHVTVISPQ
ncbi:MAG TPA: hypothetical protein VEO54_28400 [Thermoanaerobaculia bacterium]|nr:hypothetical protein [Thermoanaerobaculia bacterium]